MCLKAMIVDVLRKRIDFWRPSGIVMPVRSETRKVCPRIMKVDEKNASCRGNEKKRSKSAQLFRGKLPIQRLREKHEREERQRKNHGVVMWTSSLRCNDNLH